MKKITLFLMLLHLVLFSKSQTNIVENSGNINQQINEFLSVSINNKSLDFKTIKNQSPDYEFENNSYYWGDIKNKMPDGFGIRYLKDSTFFIGAFENGKKNGYGISLTNNQLYIGEFINDNYDGFGSLYLLNDTVNFNNNLNYLLENKFTKITNPLNIFKNFIGVFSNMEKEKKLRQFDGRSIKYLIDSNNYSIKQKITRIGKFIGGPMSGEGILEIEYPNPSSVINGKLTYIGNVDNGPIGNLVVYSVDEKLKRYTKYEGNFTNYADFKGKMTTSDGTITEGQFVGFVIQGIGKRVNGEYEYVGNFENDKFNGKGIIKYKEESKFLVGSYFDGTWLNGQAVEGTFFNAQTQEYMKGSYFNGQLNGKVTITLNGKTSTVIYRNGDKEL
jgi:hypothetical protein